MTLAKSSDDDVGWQPELQLTRTLHSQNCYDVNEYNTTRRDTYRNSLLFYRNILFFYIYRTFTKAQMQSKLLLADFLQTTVLAAICVCCTVLYVETTLLQ